MKKVRPTSDRVLIERLKAETVSPGGIHLPNKSVELSQRGKVICIGRGKTLEDGSVRKMEVKKGDLVIFASNSGIEVKIDGKPYLIMPELNIIAVIEKK